jgi:restriction endonuclease S subunit
MKFKQLLESVLIEQQSKDEINKIFSKIHSKIINHNHDKTNSNKVLHVVHDNKYAGSYNPNTNSVKYPDGSNHYSNEHKNTKSVAAAIFTLVSRTVDYNNDKLNASALVIGHRPSGD